ncbi:hypothetical protein KSP40_PGU001862 [Platanthera guangdongensis]|uniref:Uncharacterized protein n=1 Tax=Platanthera guangdongensis TaxID=2320717 RepID=A0ABR2LNY5_9ASPA
MVLAPLAKLSNPNDLAPRSALETHFKASSSPFCEASCRRFGEAAMPTPSQRPTTLLMEDFVGASVIFSISALLPYLIAPLFEQGGQLVLRRVGRYPLRITEWTSWASTIPSGQSLAKWLENGRTARHGKGAQGSYSGSGPGLRRDRDARIFIGSPKHRIGPGFSSFFQITVKHYSSGLTSIYAAQTKVVLGRRLIGEITVKHYSSGLTSIYAAQTKVVLGRRLIGEVDERRELIEEAAEEKNRRRPVGVSPSQSRRGESSLVADRRALRSLHSGNWGKEET